jgi:hypothetical protein
MNSMSVGNCRIEENDDIFIILDDIDRELLSTKYLAVAVIFRDLYNGRGSEVDLDTGDWT